MRNCKNYLFSLKIFFFVLFLVFAFAAANGYFSARSSSQETEILLQKVSEVYRPILEMNSWQQFISVFFNNGLVLFLILLLGAVFGIFPLLVLLANGGIFGVLAYFIQQEYSWSTFFLGTLPHGIIELPVFLLASAVGLKLGKRAFEKVFWKKEGFKEEFFSALNFFLKILLPLLFLAAAIEIFLTANLF